MMVKEMGKLPYFPCYARDVISSSKIALMTGDAFKAYWLLLCASWLEDDRGTLPNNQAKLQALARVDASTWLRIKSEVMACFEVNSNGRIFNPRMLEVSSLQEKRREAGSKGGSKTQAKFKAKAVAKGQASESESSSESETETKTEPKKKKRREYPALFERLWNVHPKGGKEAAYKALEKLSPDESEVDRWIAKLEAYQESQKWREGISPNLSTWINQGYFDGEVPKSKGLNLYVED